MVAVRESMTVAGRAERARAARGFVVYVDNDQIVDLHANALLTGSGTTGIVLADLRDPSAILAHPKVRELIDFTRPVALLLVAAGRCRRLRNPAGPGLVVGGIAMGSAGALRRRLAPAA